MSLKTPEPSAESRPFWDGCALGELLFQVCSACGKTQSYARAQCTACYATDLVWRASTRRGRLASFTTVYRAPSAEFETPYTIVLVEFEEGFRLMMNTASPLDESTEIGAAVSCDFRSQGEGQVPVAVLLD